MSDKIIAAIALVVGGFVGFTAYRGLSKKKSKKRIFIENAKKAGHYTEGKVEKTKVYPGILDSKNPRLRDDSLEATYKYSVNGVDYYKSIMFQSPGRIGTDYPLSITVYYKPENPKKAVCLEEAHTSRDIESGCLKTIAITILTMFATFHIIRILLG